MTKVKVKGSFLSKPVERSRPASEDYPIDEEDDEQDDLAGKSNYMPFVNANSKGKRGPRGAGRPTHRDSSGLQSSDSALGTSSSRGSDDDDGDVGDSAHDQTEQHHGFTDNAAIDSARRGSIRMKVKPSKFRENQSQSHTTPEGRSPLKKKHGGPPFDSTGYQQPFHARDYTLADRQQGHLSNELNTALMVVKKIMKMEAAEPFNVPVDPVALGIPDYFDIVKRPMDLGTICKNLERGGKYRSSRDVYEDVQLVWTNCRIYNQKGDPILELLARVKKNFMKYWTAAGLYTEKSPANFKFRGGSSETEIGSSSLKQREMQEDADYGRSKKMNKFVRDSQSPANSMAKLSPIEQGMVESKPLKLHPPEYVGGFRKEQEVASNTANDELDSYYSNREGPKVISVYKTHKKKLLEQQGHEHSRVVGPKVHEQEVEPGGRGLIVVKNPHADKINKLKDIDLQGTPGKSRRVSGTGHHKADCSCVVCTGVRRKLAREGKLPSHLVYAPGTAESPSGQERILVRLKAEGNGDRPKSHHGKTKEGKRKQMEGDRTESAPTKKLKLDDSEMASMNADSEKGNGRDDDGKATIKEEGKGHSESEGKLDSVKAGSEEEYKGGGEEMDDRDDGVQNDEHLADMLDAETERQEGGVKYYRASYEMPLRKMNPSILQVGHKLFGSGSPWSHGRSLSMHSSKRFSKGFPESSLHATVSLLLSSKGT